MEPVISDLGSFTLFVFHIGREHRDYSRGEPMRASSFLPPLQNHQQHNSAIYNFVETEELLSRNKTTHAHINALLGVQLIENY